MGAGANVPRVSDVGVDGRAVSFEGVWVQVGAVVAVDAATEPPVEVAAMVGAVVGDIVPPQAIIMVARIANAIRPNNL